MKMKTKEKKVKKINGWRKKEGREEGKIGKGKE